MALCASGSAMTGTLYVAALVALVCPDSRGPWVNRIGQFVEIPAFAGPAGQRPDATSLSTAILGTRSHHRVKQASH